MLSFMHQNVRNCEGVSRRGFLQVGTLAGLGVSLPMALAQQKAKGAENRGASSPGSNTTNCILIWTQGGTSHHDTFDPKPEAPANVKGEYGVISTAVPGIQFADSVPNMAKELNRFAILRGWNPQNGSHGTADQYVMSGRKFNPAVRYPTYGAVVSKHHGFKSVLPPFVQLGTHIDTRFGGGSSGILGLEHGAFNLTSDPNSDKFNVRDITPPLGMNVERLDRRRRMLERVDQLQRTIDNQPAAFAALDEHYQTALNMITAPQTKAAFAIEQEAVELRDKYGWNKFGQSCLLARRLVESGVRFVTVTDGGWDTHANNFKSLKERLLPPVDQAIPALLADLEARGLLQSTLVCWFTDFGRTPVINSASGRDHWSSSGFALMAGAGVPGGAVLGATSEDGGHVVRDEYLSEDLGTTVYEKLGIPTDLIVEAPDGRPIRLLEGRAIREWM